MILKAKRETIRDRMLRFKLAHLYSTCSCRRHRHVYIYIYRYPIPDIVQSITQTAKRSI